MNRDLGKELEELREAGVIDEDTATRIREYFKNRKGGSHNRLFVVFGVLGAILVGLGIVLIVAHNWDELSRPVKVIFSFLPLLAGQFCCGYALLRKQASLAWRESSAAFLFFAVGASISLVSQVYHIHGALSTFLFTWMLLCLPLVYLLRSSVASLLYIAGITYYQVVSNYSFDIFAHNHKESFNYWWMLSLVAPHYYSLFQRRGHSNYLAFHNWFVPISLTISLGAFSRYTEHLIFISYMSLFAIFYLAGSSGFFSESRRRLNGYFVIGSLGSMHLLLMLSFHWFWDERITRPVFSGEGFFTRDLFAAAALTCIAAAILYTQQRNKPISGLHPMKFIFLLYLILFMLGGATSVAPVVLVNLLILLVGVYTIRLGAKLDHLGILNYGLLTITALVVCRFFDSDMSFVVRGLLFVLVGAGFFAANYLMLKKRKEAAA